jgi:succinate dehydrogenase / fumarate reductase membrane anchor subunit
MKKSLSLRSPLGKVRGLGAAHHGTGHWFSQRITAIALIPLSIYVIYSFFGAVVFGDYQSAVDWLRSPFAATFVILFIAVGFHHANAGLQVVIEDYIHCECAKLTSIIAVKFLAVIFVVLGTLATVKILFGV